MIMLLLWGPVMFVFCSIVYGGLKFLENRYFVYEGESSYLTSLELKVGIATSDESNHERERESHEKRMENQKKEEEEEDQKRKGREKEEGENGRVGSQISSQQQNHQLKEEEEQQRQRKQQQQLQTTKEEKFQLCQKYYGDGDGIKVVRIVPSPSSFSSSS